MTESKIQACLKNRLTGTRKNSFSFSSDHLDWKDLLLFCCWRGKPRVCLAACWVTLPRVDFQTHFSFTFDTRQTFFHSAACRQYVCSPKSHTWHKTMSPLAAAYIRNIHWIWPHQIWTYHPPKRLVHCLGEAIVFLVIQEDISLLQSNCMKPKNKVET